MQAFLCVLGVLLTANSAAGVYRRWHEGGIHFVASILGVVVFGFCAFSAGYFLVTGRHLSDRFLNSASSADND
jgi:hypothetical protein